MTKTDPPKARRSVSMRWSLLRNFLLVLVTLGAAIYVLLGIQSSRAARRLAESAVKRTATRMEAELGHYFEPVGDSLRIAEAWGRTGVLPCGDEACLNRLFAPFLRRLPQLDSISTANAAGRGVMLMRKDEGFVTRTVDVEPWGKTARFAAYDADLRQTRVWEAEEDYDPRTRPWYAGTAGAAEGEIVWTEPYTFFTSGEPGMTVAIRVHPPESEPFVLAYDIRLRDLTQFARSRDVGSSGMVFVLSGQTGQILGVPNHPSLESEEAVSKATLAYVRDLDLPVVHAASKEAQQRGLEGFHTFAFPYEGERWWGAVRVFEHPAAPGLLLGVIASEEDFLGDLTSIRLQVGAAILLAAILAAFVAGWLARGYSRPVSDLVSKSERIRELDLEPAAPSRTNVTELVALDHAQEAMRQALDSFSRYVPTDVVRDLLARGQAAQIGGTELTITALFTDIQGFTSISEGMTPTALTHHMSEYFDAMVTTLRDAGATVDKLVGDAIVAFWGAPTPDATHAAHAVEGVLRCRERLETLNQRWIADQKPALPTRFGLATGLVIVGNIGAPTRLHYTALGDTMNLASRLEATSGRYGATCLVSAATVAAAGDGFVFRAVDRLAVKGKTEIVAVFELLGRRGEVADDDPRKTLVEKALGQYRVRAFEEATRTLDPLLPDDPVAAALRTRCREAIAHPPPDDWDGATRLDVK